MPEVLNKTHLREYKKQRAELLVKLKQIDKVIAGLEGERPNEIQWTQKAVDCIRKGDEFLQTAEILDCLFYNNKSALELPGKRRNYLVALSVALNKLANRDLLVKVAYPGVKGYFFGISEWMEESNPKYIKPKYQQRLNKKLKEMKA